MPLVSVVLPTYNRIDYLSRALASVVNQTYTDIEIIVVDDGSTDGTEQYMTNVADSRIRYIKLATNSGQGNARNVGIQEARGQYVAFLDSDDVWYSECLEYQLEVLTKTTDSSVGAVMCDSKQSLGTTKPENARAAYESVLFWKHQAQLNNLVVRKDCIQAIGGFDTSLIAYEDWDMMLRFCKEYRILYLPMVLADVDEHSGGRVTNAMNHVVATLSLLDKYAVELQDRPDVLSYWRYRLANQYRVAGDLQSSREQIAESLRLWPWSARRWFMYLLHLLPGMALQRKAMQLYKSVAGSANVR